MTRTMNMGLKNSPRDHPCPLEKRADSASKGATEDGKLFASSSYQLIATSGSYFDVARRWGYTMDTSLRKQESQRSKTDFSEKTEEIHDLRNREFFPPPQNSGIVWNCHGYFNVLEGSCISLWLSTLVYTTAYGCVWEGGIAPKWLLNGKHD